MIIPKIKKGDTVLLLHGKDKGKKGKVLRVFPVSGKAIVEGINQKIRHVRPRRAGEKGQRVNVVHPVWLASVMVICPHCSKSTRVGYDTQGEKKVRICKKCKGEL